MISVVIATYNRAHTIARSLESVLRQTHRDIEVLVIDDGSMDGTDEVIRKITDSRVRCVKLEKNQGASVARNRGIKEANGDYILIWDSDDVLYPNALEKILDVFKKHPEYSVVSAPAHVMSDGREVKYPEFSQGEVVLADILLKRLPSNEKIRIAKTSVMKQVSYKARNIDFLVNVELIEQGRWFHFQEYLGEVYNDSKKGSLTSLRKKRSAQRSVERAPYLAHFLEKHGEYLKKISPTRYADHCYGAATGFLLIGDTSRARRYARDAAKNHPVYISYWLLYTLAYLPGGWVVLRLFYR